MPTPIRGDNKICEEAVYQTEKLAGGTIATALIRIGQAVLGLSGTLNYFLEPIFNYPTLAECYKGAALNSSNRLARSAR